MKPDFIVILKIILSVLFGSWLMALLLWLMYFFNDAEPWFLNIEHQYKQLHWRVLQLITILVILLKPCLELDIPISKGILFVTIVFTVENLYIVVLTLSIKGSKSKKMPFMFFGCMLWLESFEDKTRHLCVTSARLKMWSQRIILQELPISTDSQRERRLCWILPSRTVYGELAPCT